MSDAQPTDRERTVRCKRCDEWNIVPVDHLYETKWGFWLWFGEWKTCPTCRGAGRVKCDDARAK